ncbi:MAG TPA: molybdate ABC transporter permease subunit [Gammaproteobacteria bacterium]|nr:molybdate ABC transporter permease subunit [Gammaproteobacteria bacterium]
MADLDLGPVWLTLRLAAVTVLLLLLVGTPLAWWLAHTRTRVKPLIEAVTALPLVLPPTVLGFYLLVLFAPGAPLGGAWLGLTGHTLTFSFSGLVLASMLYSLPFVVQPLQGAFEAVGRGPLEAAAVLGARPLDAFFTVASPLALRGYLTATVLGFAHTLGEFGVVLMVGGSIPGDTRTISIAIYDRVQAFDEAAAGEMAAVLLAISLATIALTFFLTQRVGRRHG